MLKLIKNIEVYSPEYLGKKDVLISDKTIAFIKGSIDLSSSELEHEIIDGTGKKLLPGFIDNHVHIVGGGGEGGYKTRTPELLLSTMVTNGVTTVIGCLGTDGVSRKMENLIAKAKSLNDEGVSCYIYSGSYEVPVRTLTGSIQDDIVFIEEIIGVGEIAISDHRSSHPTRDEITKIVSDARVAGMLSGKAGVVNFHIGDSHEMLKIIEEILESTTIPIKHFVPTHINRNPYLFENGVRFAKRGGHVDFTTSTTPQFLEEGEVKCSIGLRMMLENEVPINNITFSSDGQGSMPFFDTDGKLIGLRICTMASLYPEVVDSVKIENIPLDDAIRVITSNCADKFKLSRKGYIKEGFDADLVLVDADTLEIDTVIALGKIMVKNKELIVKGTFE